jgi:hypothetical protein
MPYQLHKILVDGSVTHEEFTKEAWGSGSTQPGVLRMWGHAESRCEDPQDSVPRSPNFTTPKDDPLEVVNKPSVLEDRANRKPRKPEQGSLFD